MTSVNRHVAQINVARFRRPKEDPANKDFMDALDHVNAMAEAQQGFVWRLVGDGGNATGIEVLAGDGDFIINMSVWTSVEALEAFAYRQADHRAVLARRNEWFEDMDHSLALWWVDPGHEPSVDEGMAMLARLAEHGPGDSVFTFRSYREGLRSGS